MLAVAARPMGYRVVVLDPDANCPAAPVADEVIAAAFDDAAALERLALACQVITLEFENVPADGLALLEARVPVRPGRRVLETARDRIAEKTFVNAAGAATAPWAAVRSDADLDAAAQAVGFPAILKTATLGYDGKGQARVHSPAELREAFARFATPCVLEGVVAFALELSVIVARSATGETGVFAPFENRHANGILDATLWPAESSPATLLEAQRVAVQLAEALEVMGLLTVEFFVTGDDRVLVNELAPRPHNSGHLTIEASPTSQFEQAIRAVCGLPLGKTMPVRAAAMLNVLGNLWDANEPRWHPALEVAGTKLHLYGKRDARPGRKMGHITVTASSTAKALDLALEARSRLTKE